MIDLEIFMCMCLVESLFVERRENGNSNAYVVVGVKFEKKQTDNQRINTWSKLENHFHRNTRASAIHMHVVHGDLHVKPHSFSPYSNSSTHRHVGSELFLEIAGKNTLGIHLHASFHVLSGDHLEAEGDLRLLLLERKLSGHSNLDISERVDVNGSEKLSGVVLQTSREDNVIILVSNGRIHTSN